MWSPASETTGKPPPSFTKSHDYGAFWLIYFFSCSTAVQVDLVEGLACATKLGGEGFVFLSSFGRFAGLYTHTTCAIGSEW